MMMIELAGDVYGCLMPVLPSFRSSERFKALEISNMHAEPGIMRHSEEEKPCATKATGHYATSEAYLLMLPREACRSRPFIQQ